MTEKVLATFQNNSQSIPDFFQFDPAINALRRHYHNESITPPGESTEFSVNNETTLEFVIAISTIVPSSLTAPNSTAQDALKYQVEQGNPQTLLLPTSLHCARQVI